MFHRTFLLSRALGCLAIGIVFFANDTHAQKPGVEIVQTFRGHGDSVYTVALTPDGQRLVTGSFDNSVRLWDLASGKELKVFGGPQGHTKMVNAVAVSSDGSAVISGGVEPSLKVWDLPGNTPYKTFPQAEGVTRIALSPQGNKLALATVGGKVIVVDPADFKEQAAFDAGSSESLVVAANGAPILSGGSDGRLAVLDVAKKQTIHLGAHRGPIRQVAVSGGLAVSAGDDGMVRVWTLGPIAGKTLPPLSAPSILATMSDNQNLLTLGADKSLRLVALSTGKDKAFTGATSDITAIASAPASVVAGQADGKWTLWSTADGKLIGQVPSHSGKITAIAFHPQQPQIAVGGVDGTIKLWPLAAASAKPEPPKDKDKKDAKPTEPTPLLSLDAHPGGVASLQFAANGTLVSAGADKKVKLWDLGKKSETKAFGPLIDSIVKASLSADAQSLVVAAGKHVRVYNVADGKEIVALPHPADVRGFALKADKTRIATACGDKQTRLWDIATGKELQWWAFNDPVGAVFSDPATGAPIVSIAGTTISIDTPAISRVIATGAGPINAMVAAPSSFVFTGGTDKTIQAWNPTTGALDKLAIPPLPATIRALAISKAGTMLAGGGDDKIVRFYSLPDGKELASHPVDAAVRDLVFTPNGQALLVNTANKKMFALNSSLVAGQPLSVDFGKPIQVYAPAAAVTDFAATADNATFYAPAADKTVQLWKIASSNPVKQINHPPSVSCIAIHPKSPTIVATGSQDGKLRIIDIAKGAIVKEIVAHAEKDKNHPIYTVAFSPDGGQVLTSSYDHSLKLWDANAGTLVREFKGYNEKTSPSGHKEEVYAAAFSPDGKLIASGSGGLEKAIKIWKTDDASVIRNLVNPAFSKSGKDGPSHPGWIYHVRFLNNGKLLTIGDAPKNRGYIAVWNVGDGKLDFGETTEFGSIFNAALSPDQKTLVVGAGARGPGPGDFNHARLIRVPGVN
jgi:WD40 repeat protein